MAFLTLGVRRLKAQELTRFVKYLILHLKVHSEQARLCQNSSEMKAKRRQKRQEKKLLYENSNTSYDSPVFINHLEKMSRMILAMIALQLFATIAYYLL
jgi:hypothetical protein